MKTETLREHYAIRLKRELAEANELVSILREKLAFYFKQNEN
jgi:hypothetical protein